MANQHEVLAATLDSFPLVELTTGEQKATFLGIKERLLKVQDVQQELKTLYRVTGFADFAAGLLWIVDRAEKSPGSVTGVEDETLLLATFRRAVGEQAAEPEPEVVVGEGGPEKNLAAKLDRFSEAVQGGTEVREEALVELVKVAEGSEVQTLGDDAAQFGMMLAEFLKYIAANQLFDDIRVINIFANVSSSITLWANSPADNRTGLLEEALSLVRDYKNQFE